MGWVSLCALLSVLVTSFDEILSITGINEGFLNVFGLDSVDLLDVHLLDVHLFSIVKEDIEDDTEIDGSITH